MREDRNFVVLFYPTSVVHFRNLELLKKNLRGFKFLVIVESWVREKARHVLSGIDPEEQIAVENGRLQAKTWEKKIDILYLSMAYPNFFRLLLVHEAVKRNIPVLAIEEVNQLALNDGIINHYFLPIDNLGVASFVEKEEFLKLGIPEDTLTVTGWPFFVEEAAWGHTRVHDIKKEYSIPSDRKCCLLFLGSLKEYDMVSLETRKVRREILEIVSKGLSENFQLMIKPHPIETRTAMEEIKKQVPDALLLDPLCPVEPLLAQADAVATRGNSQISLLALLENKSPIVVPAGLNTIFHGCLESIIADSALQFRQILERYAQGEIGDCQKILAVHFPLAPEQAIQKVKELFDAAIGNKRASGLSKKIHISILYAFLGDMKQARNVLAGLPKNETLPLLKRLFGRHISRDEFKTLLDYFPGKIFRWHLQALYARRLAQHRGRNELSQSIDLLSGFDGDTNPHYFMEDILLRIELEYRAGNDKRAEDLIEKFYDNYAVFDYFRQAFDMLRFVYYRQQKSFMLRKMLWLLKNLNTAYSRKYIKNRLGS